MPRAQPPGPIKERHRRPLQRREGGKNGPRTMTITAGESFTLNSKWMSDKGKKQQKAPPPFALDGVPQPAQDEAGSPVLDGCCTPRMRVPGSACRSESTRRR